MLDGRARSADAMALDRQHLCESRVRISSKIMERQPKLAQALLGALCARLRVLTDQVEAIALFPLETRLARLFLQLIAARGESGASRPNTSKRHSGGIGGAHRSEPVKSE